MSYFKFSENLFIGKQELQTFKKFLDDKGFRYFMLANAGSFGLVTDKNRALNNNFLPNVGTNANTLKYVEESYAINGSGNAIYQPIQDNIDISAINDSAWRWLKISHQYSPIELGTVSISAAGVLTGVNTKFTEVLRGQTTGFPSKISFPGAVSNISSYEVAEVIDDTNALLSGVFTSENSLKYNVVGTFTPGSIQSPTDKNVFQYDSVVYTFVLETVENTAPAGLVSGSEFWIARIKNASGTISIQDKRTETFKEKGLVLAETNEADITAIETQLADISARLTALKKGNQYYVAVGETLQIDEFHQFYLKERILENDGTILNNGEIYIDN